MVRHIVTTFVCCGVLLPLSGSARGDVGGSRGRLLRYTNSERGEAPKDILFSIDLDRHAFRLTTWGGKYRLVRVRIENRGDQAVRFSSADDEVHAVRGGKRVAAQLTPSQGAPDLWERLDPAMRHDLVYPMGLGPKNETIVYLFFPAEALSEPFERLEWHIASRAITFVIEPPPVPAH